ncbi:MAG: hypothetical protein GXP35_12760, partial [Actinobacteria bacterium]|nr:hypothetical protein [Actinomycetota bacterium]
SVEYAQGRIEDLLAGEDFGDWTLGDVVPGPAERPCASFSLDVAAKVILLVPVPEPPAGEQGS